jgi:hypothetical protein
VEISDERRILLLTCKRVREGKEERESREREREEGEENRGRK